jgi:hydroxyethylthiazole kinase
MPAEGEMHGPERTGSGDLPNITAAILERLRARRPRVHCITNMVAQTFTANMLLAAGAIPSMTIAADEVASFVARADALLVNLGTFDAERRTATGIAIETATDEGIPWALDPVFIDRSDQRAAYAKSLIAKRPRVVRLNAAEFAALAGQNAQSDALAHFAVDNLTTIGLTGATDLVTDGVRLLTISNGDPLMERVTAMGCAATALVAACLAVESDAMTATAAALLWVDIAGEVAASRARGPGSFAVEIIDAIHAIDGETIRRLARVQ